MYGNVCVQIWFQYKLSYQDTHSWQSILSCFFFLNRSPPISGFLDDYAFIICGLLDLYEATMQTEWLQWAEELQLRQDTLFWDSAGGGYFCSDPSDSTVLLQLKEGERETYSHISLAYHKLSWNTETLGFDAWFPKINQYINKKAFLSSHALRIAR